MFLYNNVSFYLHMVCDYVFFCEPEGVSCEITFIYIDRTLLRGLGRMAICPATFSPACEILRCTRSLKRLKWTQAVVFES